MRIGEEVCGLLPGRDNSKGFVVKEEIRAKNQTQLEYRR